MFVTSFATELLRVSECWYDSPITCTRTRHIYIGHFEKAALNDRTAKRSLNRGKILHTRNQHLRTHRGLSMACSNGLSFQWIFNCQWYFPKDSHFSQCCCFWNCPTGCPWHFPTGFHFCDFRCVFVCPDRRSTRNIYTHIYIYIYIYIYLYVYV